MSQFILYFLPKALVQDKATEIAKSAGFISSTFFDDNCPSQLQNFYTFADGNWYLHGSIVSMLKDSDFESFEDYKVRSKQTEVERLQRIKDLMESDGYEAMREAFEAEKERLSEALNSHHSSIRDKEIELTDAIMVRTDISDNEKSRLMHETVYPELNRLRIEIDNKPEVIAAQKACQKYITDNALMWDSCMYTLEKVQSQVHEMIPLTQKLAIKLAGYTPQDEEEIAEADVESFSITLPSNNIYDTLEAARNNDFADYLKEFNTAIKYIKAALNCCDEVKVLAFWASDKIEIAGERIVKIRDFKIDDLLFLPYLTILTITK